MTLSELLIGFSMWAIVTLIICLPICNYIIIKTDREELSYLVFPVWLILSMFVLGIYLN
jgi:hypothetical protein